MTTFIVTYHTGQFQPTYYLTIAAIDAETALGLCLNEPEWTDARDWPIDYDSDGMPYATDPDDGDHLIDVAEADVADDPLA